jgi:hypothetical protein
VLVWVLLSVPVLEVASASHPGPVLVLESASVLVSVLVLVSHPDPESASVLHLGPELELVSGVA